MQCSYCGFSHEAGLNFCPATGRPLEANGNLVGSVLEGKYRLTRHLDYDGLFSIYQAEHEVIGRRQVVYVASVAAPAEEMFVEQVLTTLREAAKLGHENLVELNDMGRDAVLGPYAVFEWLAGESLGTWLTKHAPLHPGHAILLFSQILSALEAAHDRGLVHGNLTPGSIILLDGPGSRVKVRGLGVFHPENPGPAEDLYQVGSMLYFALTGIQVQGDSLHRPSASRPQLSLMLDEAVLRALGEDRNEGPWKTARQMREALEWAAKAGERPADSAPPPIMVNTGPVVMYAEGSQPRFSAPPAAVDVPPVMVATAPPAPAPRVLPTLVQAPKASHASALAPTVLAPAVPPPSPTAVHSGQPALPQAPISPESTGEAQFWSGTLPNTYEDDDLEEQWEKPKRRGSSVVVASIVLGCALFVGLAYMVSRNSDTRAASGNSQFAAPVRQPDPAPTPAPSAPTPAPSAPTPAPSAPAVPPAPEPTVAQAAEPSAMPQAQAPVGAVEAPAPTAAMPALPVKELPDITPPTPFPRTSRSSDRAGIVASARKSAMGENSKPKAAPVTRRKIITDNPY